MSWWNRIRVQRRTAVAVVAISALAGAGTAWAVTGGDDGAADLEAKPTTTATTPTPSAEPSEASGSEGTGTGAEASTGSLTVTIQTPGGENPFDARFVVIDATTGQEVGPENGTLADISSQAATLSGITPGTYVVTAGSDDDRWRAAWYGPPSAEYDRSNATPITIGAGQTAAITITLREFPNGEPPEDDESDEDPTTPTPTPAPSPSTAPDAG